MIHMKCQGLFLMENSNKKKQSESCLLQILLSILRVNRTPPLLVPLSGLIQQTIIRLFSSENKNQFSGKIKKKISKCCLLIILPKCKSLQERCQLGICEQWRTRAGQWGHIIWSGTVQTSYFTVLNKSASGQLRPWPDCTEYTQADLGLCCTNFMPSKHCSPKHTLLRHFYVCWICP